MSTVVFISLADLKLKFKVDNQIDVKHEVLKCKIRVLHISKWKMRVELQPHTPTRCGLNV